MAASVGVTVGGQGELTQSVVEEEFNWMYCLSETIKVGPQSSRTKGTREQHGAWYSGWSVDGQQSVVARQRKLCEWASLRILAPRQENVSVRCCCCSHWRTTAWFSHHLVVNWFTNCTNILRDKWSSTRRTRSIIYTPPSCKLNHRQTKE